MLCVTIAQANGSSESWRKRIYPRIQLAYPSTSVELSCYSGIVPIWKKDKQSLPLFAKHSRIHFYHKLSLHDVNSRHNGTYSCTGTDEETGENFTEELYVIVGGICSFVQ